MQELFRGTFDLAAWLHRLAGNDLPATERDMEGPGYRSRTVRTSARSWRFQVGTSPVQVQTGRQTFNTPVQCVGLFVSDRAVVFGSRQH